MSTSLKAFYESINPNDLRIYQPCDASRVWTVLDNIKHLCDSQPKYIVNFAGSPSALQYYSLSTTPIPIFGGWLASMDLEYTFPCTTLQLNRFCNYDVRLAACTTSGTLQATVAIGNSNAIAPADGNDTNIVGICTGSTSSTTAAIVINTQIVQSKASVPMTIGTTSVQSIASGHAGQSMQSGQFYGKVFVSLRCGVATATDYMTLSSLMIREYTP